ncbi:50S ribosomal protein L27 [Candidatus Giovannonibacteria bacterium RIFCSPLOWO2_01_FULL_43_160]|uniref:Large ribosomal subunit protein bL27 n=2 Tax=Candidatus Giovannoniibacteriota TaxID=1752738 RepID=A0A0G1ITY9_9BACT|nr:MAG: Ribosomal protein L27 [Candidatus Giovannonibacteria bacterium GW2011_GWB1_43_13]KKS99055.1 MAG: Ribosomal protein L27 [Candidatus Giovannonibacteria bacterium GW2011_GWA1_43_15]KKT21620.1 MAG: Ribosomal protein L27 [Candidatus Giovannonibacteria bacterium GW2011_GWC2_43_8]KKT62811.1 MAG: Ribosomal protein L27 [Candidatus Giovannonibacteria bacterium GW2011_GWA2_44_26]OGF59353.1 MAG: 50S ribosomal protein L27 [Candidatus Giovannonibacteria bacterium RIFCSPHIGHO2_01_FULL_43_140]OGF69662
MAHTKAGGSSQNARDSQPKYLGIKLYAGEKAKPGAILVRQRGTKFIPGAGVRIGKDDTIYAVKEGVVRHELKRKIRFDGSKSSVHKVSVI